MRTSLEYYVIKEEEYDYKTEKTVNRVKSRGFEFCVTGCKTEEEHNQVLDSFQAFLEENEIESDGFGDGTWEEAIQSGDEKNYSYLDIPVTYIEEKEYIKDLYKEWKKRK